MKKTLLLILVFFSIEFSHAQCSTWEWAKSAGGDSSAIQEGLGLCTDISGNVIITGVYTGISSGTSTIIFDTYTFYNSYPSGVYRIYIVKYDAAGNVLWAKSPTGSGMGYSVSTDAAGNIYAAGSIMSSTLVFGSYTLTNSSASSMYLVKYDPAGNVIWARSSSGGGVYGRAVCAGTSKYVYVSGYTTSPSATFGSQTITSSGNEDAFIVKYDETGNAIWARSGGGSGNDEGYSVTTDPFGNGYITGQFKSPTATFGTYSMPNSNPGSSDIFVVKYDSIGNIDWVDNFGGTNDDIGNSLSADNNGNVVVTGFFSCPSMIFGTDTLLNTSGYNLFVVKYDPMGNITWAKAPAPASISQGYWVDTDNMGNAYVTGFSFSTPLIIGPLSIPNAIWGSDAMIFIKFAPDGTPLCGNTLGSGGDDVVGIAADDFGNVFIAGDIAGSVFVGSTYLPLIGLENAFVAKLAAPLGINENKNGKDIAIYPNPLSAGNTISISQVLHHGYIQMTDGMGRKVADNYFSGTDTGISNEQLGSGIYFITILSDEGRFTAKFLIR